MVLIAPKPKCRLLYLVGQLGAGGLERQLCYLLQGMDRDRYLPVVVVWNYKEDDLYVARIRKLGLEVLSIPTKPSPFLKLLGFRRLVGMLRPEVVHSYSFYTNFAAYWGVIGRRGIAIGSVRGDFTKSVKDAGRLLGKLSARYPRTQIFNSLVAAETAKSSAQMFGSKQIVVVRNGLDLTRFPNLKFPYHGKARILAVGSLSPVKRWDRLLKAVVGLKQHRLDFLVQIVGDGPLSLSLKQQADLLGVDDCVEFLGHRDDIEELLASSCFLVHTSDSEGCPNVVMEAMACARAVVITDVGDAPHLVENGKTGFVVQRSDEKELVARMVTLLGDRELCCQMGEFGRAKAERQFGLNRLLSETFAAYAAAGWHNV